MVHQQKGFNILELIIVLIVLAILGAIAVPKMLGLLEDEKNAALKEVTTTLTTASTTNVKARKQDIKKGIAIHNCIDAAKLLPNGLPEGYKLLPQALITDTKAACMVVGSDKRKKAFTLIAID